MESDPKVVYTRREVYRLSKRYNIDVTEFLKTHHGDPIMVSLPLHDYLKYNSLNNKNKFLLIKTISNRFRMGEKDTKGISLCSHKGVLSRKAYKILRDLSSKSVDEKGEHHEKGGLLKFKKLGNIYIFEVDEASLVKGGGNDTDVPIGKVGFHTHPDEEYTAQGVSYAWPSGDDYEAFRNKIVDDKTILHLVVTKEGIYFISLHPNAVKGGKKFIKKGKKMAKRYKFPLPSGDEMTPRGYISEIKKIPSKGRFFHVEFYSYEDLDKEPKFDFYFPSEGQSCALIES